MNLDGEEDSRAVYCAVSVAVLLNIPLRPLFDLSPFWLADCQTYEGASALSRDVKRMADTLIVR